MTRRQGVAAAAVGPAGAIAVGHVAAGAMGALATASALAVLGMAIVWLSMAASARPPVPAGPGGRADPLAPFVAYRKIKTSLNWARTSEGHYDRAVRPVLTRLLAARLAERHGVDLMARPDLAREIVGADLWRYLDPARIGPGDSTRPGVPDDILLRIADRLEEL